MKSVKESFWLNLAIEIVVFIIVFGIFKKYIVPENTVWNSIVFIIGGGVTAGLVCALVIKLVDRILNKKHNDE